LQLRAASYANLARTCSIDWHTIDTKVIEPFPRRSAGAAIITGKLRGKVVKLPGSLNLFWGKPCQNPIKVWKTPTGDSQLLKGLCNLAKSGHPMMGVCAMLLEIHKTG